MARIFFILLFLFLGLSIFAQAEEPVQHPDYPLIEEYIDSCAGTGNNSIRDELENELTRIEGDLPPLAFQISTPAPKRDDSMSNDEYMQKLQDFFEKSNENVVNAEGMIYNDYINARFFCLRKDYPKAKSFALNLYKYCGIGINETTILMPESDRDRFFYQLQPIFNLLYSVARNIPSDAEQAKLCYNNQLTYKGILLNTNIKLRDIIQSSKISKKNLYEESDTLQTGIPQGLLPYPVSEKIPFSWQEVQAQLKPDDIAIEFVSFDENDEIDKNNTAYMALVLRKAWMQPQIVPLCYESDLRNIMNGYSPDNIRSVAELYRSSKLHELYDLLWKPLEAYLSGVKNVYYSTSGTLNRISMQVIANPSEVYNMYQLSSTRELVKGYLDNALNAQQAVVFGQINYNLDKNQMQKQGGSYTLASQTKSINTFSIINDENEINDFINYCKNAKLTCKKYLGNEATEETFKSLSGSNVSLLHISTHGTYINTNDIEKYPWLSQDERELYPMQRSLLAFAGANNYWLSNNIPKNTDDGILSAQEISGLKFTNLDLVVLSACQSALGDIDNYEGVFGLVRAFKLSGANTLILTLWNVRSDVSEQFMKYFYEALQSDIQGNKKSKHDAFRYAQKEIRGSYPEPENWGAFIMID